MFDGQLLGLLQLLREGAPAATRLLTAYRAAMSGDPRAREYLRSRQAVKDLAALVYPDRAWMVEDILTRWDDLAAMFRALVTGQVPWVEGEFRPAGSDRAPWTGFVDRLKRQGHGVHIIIGPRGSGKTTLAKKLAWVWLNELGYKPEFVNMYGTDKPSWGVTILPETLIKRTERIVAHFRSQAEPDPDDPEPLRPPEDPGLPTPRKTIVMDESSMTFQRGTVDSLRNAVFAIHGNLRHVEWNIVIIAQLSRMIPLEYFANATIWLKWPTGTEKHFDRDNALLIDLWEEAEETLYKLPQSPWWSEPYNRREAWAYVSAPELNYVGPVPFTPPPEEGPADMQEDSDG